MAERDLNCYQIEQNDKDIYILTTSLLNDKLKIICKDSKSQEYIGIFTLSDLMNISQYFKDIKNVEQIQKYINKIIEKQSVEISQNDNNVKLIIYLINNDNIIIPLAKKTIVKNNNENSKKNIYADVSTITSINKQYLNIGHLSNPEISKQTPNNININTIINNAKLSSSHSQKESSNKHKKEKNQIIPQKEKEPEELKQIIDQENKYIKEIIAYKEENIKLIKENTSLKKENNQLQNQINNFKKEVKEFQSITDLLKREFISIQKSITSSQDTNLEILKLNEQYENENEELKNNIEIFSKENSELKSELEKIKKEIQNNPIKEELNYYKQISQENERLKNQVSLLENQIQELYQQNQEYLEEEEESSHRIKQEVKGDIIHSLSELELITNQINKKNKKLIIKLLYKASVDSDKAEIFHKKCDSAKNTIVLIETKDGKRFGGYTTCSWSGNCVEKGDKNAFIFSFDKMKTYKNIPDENAIGCYPKFGPVFLGCQIKIYDNAFTKGGTTFERKLNYYTEEDFELTGGKQTFEVKDIEVYDVVFEKL